MSKINKWEYKMIEELEENGLKILMYLQEREEAKLSDFKMDLRMGSNAVYRILTVLLYKYKLITEEFKGVSRIFRLTERGKKVAGYLKLADQALSEGP